MQKFRLPDRPKPYLMAHRGNRARFPENTLAAFRCAVDDRADIVETDLQITSDGEFICLHDPTLDRTTDGQGAVGRLSLEQVRAYNAAARRPDLPAEPIPTIAELARAVPSPVYVALELKAQGFKEAQICARLAQELHRCGLAERSVILSFSKEHLQAFRSIGCAIPVGWITASRPWPPANVELFGPYWPLLIVNPALALIAHAMGQLICPLDPQPEGRLGYYRLLGCDAVLSDDPAKTAAALGRG